MDKVARLREVRNSFGISGEDTGVDGRITLRCDKYGWLTGFV